MKTRIFAILAAAMMIAVGGIAIADASDDLDASLGFNTVNVYFSYTDSDNSAVWVSDSIEKFNLYEAVAGVSLGYTLTADSSWTTTTTYTYPSVTYGTVSAVTYNSTTYSSGSFTIYAYNETTSVWDNVTNCPLGWMRPFTDYGSYVQMVQVDADNAAISAYSNIAISVSSETTPSSSALESLSLASLTNPSGLAAFLYTFEIKDSTNSLSMPSGAYGKQYSGGTLQLVDISSQSLSAGVTVYGYGSDAWLALLDATGGTATDELQGQAETWIDYTTYYTHYSWMDTLLGTGTQYGGEDDEWSYRYWTTYQCMNGSDNYASFNLGYHSMVDGFYSYAFSAGTYYCTGNSFLIQYEES